MVFIRLFAKIRLLFVNIVKTYFKNTFSIDEKQKRCYNSICQGVVYYSNRRLA